MDGALCSPSKSQSDAAGPFQTAASIRWITGEALRKKGLLHVRWSRLRVFLLFERESFGGERKGMHSFAVMICIGDLRIALLLRLLAPMEIERGG